MTPAPRAPAHWELTDAIPERMPLLDEWLAHAAPSRPLAGVTLLLIQHQLGNHVPQARALLELGVAPRDLHWIDIPYTATPAVRDHLIRLGIPRENFVVGDYGLLDAYATHQRKKVQSVYRRLLEQPPRRLVVLDDGSYFLEAMASFKARLPSVAIVEQTTRGLIKIEDDAALELESRRVPIINVARSDPKMRLEPPFIGYAVCDALRRRIGSRLVPRPNDRALVVGFGAIGRQVAAFLAATLGFAARRVHVHDVDEKRQAAAAVLGHPPWDRRDFEQRFRLVVGCSGRASFRVGDHVYLEDGALLASASSGSVELSREEFIELAQADPDDDIHVVGSGGSAVHGDLHFTFRDRTATFVNAGFPVNFDGRVNCVPSHYIQPTPTMMCAAALQAAGATVPGVQSLEAKFGGWLEARFRELLGSECDLLPSG